MVVQAAVTVESEARLVEVVSCGVMVDVSFDVDLTIMIMNEEE